MTMASAAGENRADMGATDNTNSDDLDDESAEDLLTPPAQQQASQTPLSQVAPPVCYA